MAIVYSYPLNKNIKLSDELVGTTEQMINGRLKTVTRNFLLSDIGEFFTAGGGLQAKIILTTTGSSGPATLDDITGVLNIPEYLSGTVTSITALSPLTGGTITDSGSIGIQIASGTQSGALSFANWNTFNNKQNLITLTVNGSSGAATFNQTTGALNIPQYSGSTNLDYIASASNGIVTSSTGLDATIPLANSINAGLLKPAKFTVLENTSGTNTGDQDLQSVTDEGATTTNTIIATVTGANPGIAAYSTTGNGVYGQSDGKGVYGYSFLDAAIYGYAKSVTGIGVKGYAEDGVGGEFETDAFSANIANFKKSGVLKAFINNTGELTAQKLIKEGGFDFQFLKADGSVDNNTYLTSADLPSTLDLYATTSPDPIIAGYTALVRNITDSRYNTVAVDVPTPTITGTLASPTFCGAVISDPSVLLGNPGVFNFSVIGKIRRSGGSTSSGADFFYSIYKRDLAGVETLIANSAPVVVPANGAIYVEYISIALWNNGIFLSTDRVVLKFYGVKTGGGSGATYEFQFGGSDPVRGTAAISSAIIPNIYLKDLADVEKVPAQNNEILYWNDPASLWEHTPAIDLIPDASATNRGVLSSADWITFNNKQPSSLNLTSLSGLTYSTSAFVKMTAAGTFTLDTSSGGTITLSAIGSTPNANAATITGSVLNLQPANENFGGVITTGTQLIAGAKTFQSGPSAPTASASNNSTLIATTEYVDRQIGLGGPAYNILIGSGTGMGNITTQTTGTSGGTSYSQNGRNVMINNGATAITVAATVADTATDFIASYTKIGTATITFTFTGTGFVFITPNGSVLSGSAGSTALLTKNGSTVYLLINNIF